MTLVEFVPPTPHPLWKLCPQMGINVAGLDVPVRGDHVPEMAYDRVLTPDGTPGYFTLGRLFANGYLKALLRSIA